jgi:hypothetical protein
MIRWLDVYVDIRDGVPGRVHRDTVYGRRPSAVARVRVDDDRRQYDATTGEQGGSKLSDQHVHQGRRLADVRTYFRHYLRRALDNATPHRSVANTEPVRDFTATRPRPLRAAR